MNCVVLIGRWVKDLELKYLPGSGNAVATGTLAVDRRFSKDGQKEADFIPIVIYGKTAESASTHTGKGKLCGVKGRINTRSYDAKDGSKRYVTEIIAEEVQFLEWANAGNQGNSSMDEVYKHFNDKGIETGFGDEITPVDDDGDIPF